MSDKSLEDMFAAARSAAPEPSAALLARIAQDAGEVQQQARAKQRKAGQRHGQQPALRAVRSGLWAQLAAALGGWPAVASLATATVAGVWIGISPPESLIEPLLDPLNAALDTSVLSGFDTGGTGFDFTQFEG